MRLTSRSVVEQSLVRLEIVQAHIRAVDAAREYALSVTPSWRGPADTGTLRARLIDLEIDEWRKLCLWGLTLSDEERDRIKAAAYQRFLSPGGSMADWLSPDGAMPGAWLAADEEAFREMARKAFAPAAAAGGEAVSDGE